MSSLFTLIINEIKNILAITFIALFSLRIYFVFSFNARDEQNVDLPPFGQYATGIFFLDKLHHQDSESKFAALAEELGMQVLAWRTVPTDNSSIGTVAKNTEPFMRQVCETNNFPPLNIFVIEVCFRYLWY